MRVLTLAVILGTAISLPVIAQTTSSPPASGTQTRPSTAAPSATQSAPAAQANLSAQDLKFVHVAASGGMAEVEAGKTAQQKATSAAVKDFGRKMVEDHGKSNEKLMGIAKAKNVSVPGSLGAEHKKMVDDLQATRNADFDRTYMTKMVDAHKKTVQLMEEQIRAGQDAELKAFATETLPTVRHHLQMAEGLAKQAQIGQR